MSSTPEMIDYAMKLTATEASTGFFACVPDPEPDLEDTLAYLEQHPMDSFMYRHALGLMGQLPLDEFLALKARAGQRYSVLDVLLYEAALSHPHSSQIDIGLYASRIDQSAYRGPLITLRAMARPDHDLHRNWNRLLAANLNHHQLLPHPDQAPYPFPYRPEAVADPGGVYITQILSGMATQGPAPTPRPSAEETAELALEKLRTLDLLEGTEMRHESSLSPYGLLHKWRLELKVDCGRHHYTLSGLQTAYGRGLTLADARASYAMEIVERCSSFAAVGSRGVLNYRQAHQIYRGSRSALAKGAAEPIDPNEFGAEAPYGDEPLHWIQGARRTLSGDEAVLVPVQSVFLFTNLDEVDLYAGHGSTGLASGNTMAEAKLSALMELVERDGEATHPFHHSLCFQVETRDARVAALLEDYDGRGIRYQFQDISPPYGIPCCKCYVTDMDGRIAKGTAASLNGGRAILSVAPALRPSSPSSRLALSGLLQLPRLLFEQLPDYSSGNVERDLALVESLLLANGIAPIYVDLTRRDLQIPVVRALLPGFALSADLDSHAPVHPRLFGNYLKIFGSVS